MADEEGVLGEDDLGFPPDAVHHQIFDGGPKDLVFAEAAAPGAADNGGKLEDAALAVKGFTVFDPFEVFFIFVDDDAEVVGADHRAVYYREEGL